MKRILITGAAGRLGHQLRHGLAGLAPVLRLSDVAPMAPVGPGEEVVEADLADAAAVDALLEGVDAVVHFGAIPTEDSWANILRVNIDGCHNVFEAARRHGAKRIVFASSNHAIGMHERTRLLDADVPTRPDSYYGLSKVIGENLARLYYDKHGIEAACLRIGSCFPKPENERMLATWLSYADLVQLVTRCLTTPRLGFAILYGASDNARRWWDNGKAGYVGFRPLDSADVFAAEVLAEAGPVDPSDPAQRFQGGPYAAAGYTRTPE